MAGNFSVETCGNIFQRPNRNASSNYGIDSTGRIGLYVEEKDRAWCSGGKDKNGRVIRVNGISGADWDQRSISIEVANDGGADTGWHVSDKALESLINLLVDICQRNGIKKLLWKNDKTLVGKMEQQNMALHRWFANKSCPGDFLVNKHAFITEHVNSRLNGENPVETPNTQAQYHTVVKDDTMTKIAIKYNTSLPELKRLNPQIKNISLIRVGKKIRVK
jgi:LysM repeat protein